MKTVDLLWLIEQEPEEINAYLGDVPHDQFVKDIKELIRKTSDKGVIKLTIDNLQKLL